MVLRNNEFLGITRKLEEHYSIFSRLWALGTPTFTRDLPTAGIAFDRVGETIGFMINPDFWATLSDDQKAFVISHECLHAILHHGLRSVGLKQNEMMLANVAMDVVVNHLLINRFGYDRQMIDPTKKYCWVDTVFPENTPPDDKTFEFYFNLLKMPSSKKEGGGQGEKGLPQIVDDHSQLPSFDNDTFENSLADTMVDNVDQIKDVVKKHLDDIEKTCKEAGFTPGDSWRTANVGWVKKKKKWETIIKKWALKAAGDSECEQWARRARRLSFMGEFFIPSDVPDDFYEKERISVWFFQDTSGSCSHLADRFFRAAMTLPPERFDVRMHCFDTRVYKTSLKTKKLYGFGGTSFSCIERFIRAEIQKENISYPKAVWVITDGYGDCVTPLLPKRWSWFLSENYKHCIPKDSNIYDLKDFE